jgi:hypothetical protein
MNRRPTRELIDRLNRDAGLISSHFGLRYVSIDAERANVKRRYGVCYADGSIRIRLRHATSGRPLRYSSLVNTLCHELAHLRYFNHGKRFRAFYLRLLQFARAQGIYRPRPLLPATRAPDPNARRAGRAARDERSRALGPTQLDLFL